MSVAEGHEVALDTGIVDRVQSLTGAGKGKNRTALVDVLRPNRLFLRVELLKEFIGATVRETALRRPRQSYPVVDFVRAGPILRKSVDVRISRALVVCSEIQKGGGTEALVEMAAVGLRTPCFRWLQTGRAAP